jgi:hypothetical protein
LRKIWSDVCRRRLVMIPRSSFLPVGGNGPAQRPDHYTGSAHWLATRGVPIWVKHSIRVPRGDDLKSSTALDRMGTTAAV